MRIHSKEFRVDPGTKVRLDKWPTEVKPFYDSKDDYKTRIEEHIAELADQQELFFANNTYSLLVIFQAMDAAGKDSAIKHVMSGVNPQGCNVTSFKHPSPEELDHDFLWRTTRHLPERGMIGIFNRSYYEEVLIVRVHPHILRSQNIPHELIHPKRIWDDRFMSINNLESHLVRNGTKIVKIFLHLSKEEQKKRFLKRINRPDKNWKFCVADVEERQFWAKYMRAYEDAMNATSTAHAPWYVVPADDKPNARLIVSEIILHALRDLKLKPPAATAGLRRELRKVKKTL